MSHTVYATMSQSGLPAVTHVTSQLFAGVECITLESNEQFERMRAEVEGR